MPGNTVIVRDLWYYERNHIYVESVKIMLMIKKLSKFDTIINKAGNNTAWVG